MLKLKYTEDEEIRLYYTYLKILLNINQNLICETPDSEIIKVKRNKFN